ncbi:MAG TPA: hypothetical protein VFL57_08260 [Bryobacteraceae bacterium]|nr:hypothetical protein [Bryobacteraceae bacterium]
MSPQSKRLVRHFFRRLFDVEAAGDIGVGPVLALLAVPGAIMTFSLLPKYSSLMRWFRREFIFDPDIQSMPDKYMFIAFSMTVTGLVTLIKWESLFPDRRDFANLMPLPFATSRILLAKAAALAAFIVLFALDINMVSSLAFPPVVLENHGTFRDVLVFMAVHAVTVAAASIFTLCAVLALIGMMMLVVPYPVFRRLTRYSQFAGACALLLMFFSVPLVVRDLGQYGWLPPVWFLGLYYSIHGKATPLLGSFASCAPWALLSSVVAAAGAYALSYRPFLASAAETPDRVNRRLRIPAVVFRMTDATLLPTAFERGTFRFILKTLVRSDRHTVILMSGLGVAAALAIGFVLNPARNIPPLFAVTLTIAYFLITGLRIAFAVPAELRANWLFQAGVVDYDPDPRSVARKMMLVPALLLVVLPSTLICAISLGGQIAIMHAVFLTAVCASLIGLLLLNVRAIPFTCAFGTEGTNFGIRLAAYFIGYFVFAYGLSGMEVYLLSHPISLIVDLAVLIGVWLAVIRLREGQDALIYENTPGSFDLLRISE